MKKGQRASFHKKKLDFKIRQNQYKKKRKKKLKLGNMNPEIHKIKTHKLPAIKRRGNKNLDVY